MSGDVRRTLQMAFVALALVGVVVSAVVVNFFAGLTFFGEPLHRIDLLHEMLASGLATVLLLLALPAVRGLRVPALPTATAILAVFGGLDVLVGYLNWVGAPGGGSGEPWWWAPQLFFALPTTWPILLLILATPVIRGWWSPRRPAPQDRSAALDRRRSR